MLHSNLSSEYISVTVQTSYKNDNKEVENWFWISPPLKEGRRGLHIRGGKGPVRWVEEDC